MASQLDSPLRGWEWAYIQSVVVFCAFGQIGFVLPGSPTLPELVIAHRDAYEDALDEADAAYKEGKAINVSKMEQLIESLLAKQLHRVYEMASGKKN